MATAAVTSSSRAVWHVRGTWNAREDRTASAVWLGILWVGMIAGFGLDIPRYLRETPPSPTVVHVHAAVFTTWMLLLTAQVLLVLGDRVSVHRKLGWFLVGWACLMAVMGPWAAMAAQAVDLHGPNYDPPFLSANIVDIGGFLVLLVWGFSLRKNPAAHKRMMILATVSLADPGFARFSGYFIPNEPQSVIPWFIWMYYGNVLLIVLMLGWDWWRRRLVRSFVVGAAGLMAAEFAASWVYFWGPWKAVTTGWVLAWAKHFG
ncbi:MAG TPA: hypothetical protein VMW15_08175 [Terracidiphilus sp.]|nr:hypothetical protein [Terracidiphilus sp.]